MLKLEVMNDVYGRIWFHHENKTKNVYDPSLWDALRATKKNGRQKRLIKKVLRAGGMT